MFERRLKTFLGILLAVMALLLVRAVHLQVFTRGAWVKQAEDFRKKPQSIETTRGKLLDHKGHEIAVDEACIDACVDYRAIARDDKWIKERALERAIRAVGEEGWKKLDRDSRAAATQPADLAVRADIDRMFQLLAKESGQAPEQIEEIRQQIDLRVAMRSRLRQYKRWAAASTERQADGQASWYRKWLVEGGKDALEVDQYEEVESEEIGVHPVVRNISQELQLKLDREAPRCPGLVLMPGTHRKYPYGRAAAHVLGNLAPATAEDRLANPVKNDPLRGLLPADLVGRGGLEALCEPALRGTRGVFYRQIGQPDEPAISPVPGTNVTTTIDIELQDQIRGFFEEMEVPSNLPDDKTIFKVAMHGAAVVIDVRSGAVRAMTSYPDFDPNTLAESYQQLVSQNLDAPLLNRATQSPLDPGSTIKPVVGIGAITQGLNVPKYGVMTTHTGIECTGYLVINGQKMPNGRCWVASKYEKLLPSVAHHPVPFPHRGVDGNSDGFLCFADALERSCNVYFETCGNAFGTEGLSYWYDRFGLGRETGVGISESCGFLPRQTRDRQPSVAWFSSIGQVGVRATPIQMANVAATIARDGIWLRPRLVENENLPLSPAARKNPGTIPDRVDLKLSPEALAAAKDGMIRVVNAPAGTGRFGHMDEFTVAGKTGTAQASRIMEMAKDEHGEPVIDKGKPRMVPKTPATATVTTETPWYRGWGEEGKSINHAWFVGFAPADRPQVAFAVMVQYGGSGGLTAATTAKKILMACVEHGYITPGGK